MSGKPFVAVMLTSQLFALLPMLAFPALVPEFSDLWSLSAAQAGWVVAAYFIGNIVAMPLIMPLTDRYDSRVFILTGSVLSALAALAFPLLADGFVSALILRTLAGAAHGVFYQPTLRAMAERVDEPLRSRALTLYTGNYSFGSGTSIALTGLVGGFAGWQVAFYTVGVGALIATGLYVLALKPRKPAAPPAARHPLDFRPAFRNPRAFAWMLANMGHSIEFTVMRQWLVALFVMELAAHGQADLFGITPSWFAALVALLSLPSIIVGGTMGQWLGGERAMLVIMVCTLALSVLLGGSILLSAPLWLFVILAGLYSMMISADVPMMVQGGIAAARPGELGVIMATQTAMSFAVSIPAPILFGWGLDLFGGLREPLGWSFGYLAASLIALSGGIVAVRILRRSAA
jgi:MFS family permease